MPDATGDDVPESPPAPPTWDEAGHDSSILEHNIVAVLGDVESLAAERATPGPEDVTRWHRKLFEGVDVPSPVYAGGYRGEDHPDLLNHRVELGQAVESALGFPPLLGLAPDEVAVYVASCLEQLGSDLEELDEALAGDVSRKVEQGRRFCDAASWVHGEWVRIHPFVDGNGRTARLLVAYVSRRYGVPDVFPIPGPDPPTPTTARRA
jgi:fido (protein-threonine AMPylation protein)